MPQTPGKFDWKLELQGFAVGMVAVLILVGLVVTASAAGWLPESQWVGRGLAAAAAATCVVVSSVWMRKRRD